MMNWDEKLDLERRLKDLYMESKITQIYSKSMEKSKREVREKTIHEERENEEKVRNLIYLQFKTKI